MRTYLAKCSEDEITLEKNHIAASFQEAIVDVLVDKSIAAAVGVGAKNILITGGVACNGRLRERMTQKGAENSLGVIYPPPILCTDNGAMIAAVGSYYFGRGQKDGPTLSVHPRARLPNISNT